MAMLAANHPNDPIDVIVGDWMSEANMSISHHPASDMTY
jgi:hypothetical protein